ncbi:hypothetical protein [Staphylococcus condimenti]|uniref:hypothetical protein n=1 Tax=Staphylococcus condimenti TaxID=70255 RepID=UPI000A7C127C|nr:hypothetical protein [Staphylococcus condimenti]
MKKKFLKPVFSAVATATVILTPQAVHAEATSTPDTKTVSIHDIQGTGHYSPLNNKKVQNVEGIVTYQYEIRGQHYFHMQTPDSKIDNNLTLLKASLFIPAIKKQMLKSVTLSKSQVLLTNMRLTAMMTKLIQIYLLQKSMHVMTAEVKFQ